MLETLVILRIEPAKASALVFQDFAWNQTEVLCVLYKLSLPGELKSQELRIVTEFIELA